MRILTPAFIHAAVAAALLAGCGTMSTSSMPPAQTPGNVVGLTESNKLVTFNREAPQMLRTWVAISGLPAGQSLIGIDYRPADGALYGVSRDGGVYVIDARSGMVTMKSRLKAAPDDKRPFSALEGSWFAVDFNPVADRLRIVSDTGQNLRINVDTGATINDGPINGAPGAKVAAAAYTDSHKGAKATSLYVIDLAGSAIYLQNPPNNGTLVNRAPLGSGITSVDGFDIDAKTRFAYAALTVNGTPGFYTVDVTGQTPPVLLGTWSGPERIRSFALWQQP